MMNMKNAFSRFRESNFVIQSDNSKNIIKISYPKLALFRF